MKQNLVLCQMLRPWYVAVSIGENPGAALSKITASAIYNATGKWVLDYPTTPDRVLEALGKT